MIRILTLVLCLSLLRAEETEPLPERLYRTKITPGILFDQRGAFECSVHNGTLCHPLLGKESLSFSIIHEKNRPLPSSSSTFRSIAIGKERYRCRKDRSGWHCTNSLVKPCNLQIDYSGPESLLSAILRRISIERGDFDPEICQRTISPYYAAGGQSVTYTPSGEKIVLNISLPPRPPMDRALPPDFASEAPAEQPASSAPMNPKATFHGVFSAGTIHPLPEKTIPTDKLKPFSLERDVDGDGSAERLRILPFRREKETTFYRLELYDDDGKLLWKGPEITDPEDPLFFGYLPFGETLPALLIDSNGDGRAEILAPFPTVGSSPRYFRVLRWKGPQRGFVHWIGSMAPLIRSHKKEDPLFRWKIPDRKEEFFAWIDRISPRKNPDLFQAQILVKGMKGNLHSGRAVMYFSGGRGAALFSWIRPPQGLEARESRLLDLLEKGE